MGARCLDRHCDEDDCYGRCGDEHKFCYGSGSHGSLLGWWVKCWISLGFGTEGSLQAGLRGDSASSSGSGKIVRRQETLSSGEDEIHFSRFTVRRQLIRLTTNDQTNR